MTIIDTTEMMVGGQWVTVGALPKPAAGIRGVRLDNDVFMTGLNGNIQNIYTIFSLPSPHLSILINSSNIICESTGGFELQTGDNFEVLKFDPKEKTWKLVIFMRDLKSFHGVSAVNYNDFCR